MSDHSRNPTIVEYAVHYLYKGQSPRTAASNTKKKFDGTRNLFVNGGNDVLVIDVLTLEEELWNRMARNVITILGSYKTGKEHYALDGTMLIFKQKPSVRQRLKELVVASLSENPFANDDVP